ncbi:MAG: hypothetical protein ACPG4I_01705 [Candidatus Puniceispirillaceae bacterium]
MMGWLHPSILTRPLVQSALFHVLIVLFGMVGWPFLQDKDINAQPLIIVDVVATLPKTNLAASNSAKSSPEPEQEASRKKPPPPPPPPPPPEPQVSTKAPPPKPAPLKPVIEKAEILPDKPVPVPQAKPERSAQKPKLVKVATPVSRPTPPKKPKPAPSPVKRPNKLAQKSQQKEKAEAMNGVLQNLAQASLAKKADKTKKAQQKQDKLAMANQLSAAVGEAIRAPESTSVLPLGMSEIDRLLNHISRCFVLPPGATEELAEQVVDVDLEMRRDGSVEKITFVDNGRLTSDRNYRIVALAARRAVLDCQPLPLPADKYESWKILPIGFNSTFMQRGTM